MPHASIFKLTGNLDVNDVSLRSTGAWASETSSTALANAFGAKYFKDGNHINGDGESIANCNGTDIRVACTFGGFDYSDDYLWDYAGIRRGPQGCQLRLETCRNCWAVAECIPRP